jgi:N-acetylglutamate synthase-like GNAT family acetyltransferase
MFVTRATRHDKEDIRALILEYGWEDDKLDQGTAFIARDGAVVGTVRLIEVEPQTVIVEDMLVKDGRRGEGIGARLMEAAMNARGGTLYLCTHGETIPFYERFGFARLSFEDQPESVQEFMREDGALDNSDHEHFFMKAR